MPITDRIEPVWKETRGFLGEFKAFIRRGNVVDLAVAVIIGTAFGKIVSSLVGDVIMPAIGYVVGAVDLKHLQVSIPRAGADPIIIGYGKFLQSTVDFIIIAFCVFIMVKLINRVQGDRPPAPKPPPEEIVLLTEIRDLLKAHQPVNAPPVNTGAPGPPGPGPDGPGY